MKAAAKYKLEIDAAMIIAMLLLMAYGLVGEKSHEWIGVGMLILFIAHHIANHKWYRAIEKGRYTCFRIVKTVLIGLIFLCMIGSMTSGIILSRYVFAALPVHAGYEIAGKLHILCAYWGFVLMAVHLGLHWNGILLMAGKRFKPSRMRRNTLRILAFVLAGYGITAFIRRNAGTYLLLLSHFVFFDYTEPVICFLGDYLAVLGLFVLLGFYLAKLLKIRRRSFAPNTQAGLR